MMGLMTYFYRYILNWDLVSSPIPSSSSFLLLPSLCLSWVSARLFWLCGAYLTSTCLD